MAVMIKQFLSKEQNFCQSFQELSKSLQFLDDDLNHYMKRQK